MSARAFCRAFAAFAVFWLSPCASELTESSSDFSGLAKHFGVKSDPSMTDTSVTIVPAHPDQSWRRTKRVTAAATIIAGLAVAVFVARCAAKVMRFEEPINGFRKRFLAARAAKECTTSNGEARDLEIDPTTLIALRHQLRLLELPSHEWESLQKSERKDVIEARGALETLMERYHALRDLMQKLQKEAQARSSPSAQPGHAAGVDGQSSSAQENFEGTQAVIESSRERLKEAMEYFHKAQWHQSQDNRSLIIRAKSFAKGREISPKAAKALMAYTVILRTGGAIPESLTEEERLMVKVLVEHKLTQAENYSEVFKAHPIPPVSQVVEAGDMIEDLSEMSTQLSAYNMRQEAERVEKAAAELKTLAESVNYAANRSRKSRKTPSSLSTKDAAPKGAAPSTGSSN